MSINKKDQFNKKDLALSDFAKCFSHPARITILKVLAKRNTCICGEIVDIMPLAQSTVSQHLKELKKMGLVKGTIDGPKSCYCIDWERFNEMAELMNNFIEEISDLEKDCCN